MDSRFSSSFILIIFIFFCSHRGISGASFNLINRCDYNVWPGILANAGSQKLDSTGFMLAPGDSRVFQAPQEWSGRIWGRTGCNFDGNTGQGNCATGDCGSNQIECNGAGAIPPATLAEFTIFSGTKQDFYDVSLVDGYNLPMAVQAVGGSGACDTTGCVKDLNRMCPNELRVGDGQACKSACEAFGNPEYCCSGAYASPSTCKPSSYSAMFKNACPKSYSYAYDDPTSTFTCTGADYTITFCPSLTSQKSSRDSSMSLSGTGNGQPATGTDGGSGSGSSSPEDPFPFGSSWLPDFMTGDSSRFSYFDSKMAFFIFSLIHFLL
uniref:Pathogenesis-related protein 5-like isoform X1 n=1 Tax=Nicotiana tabacum TaxID=4097 RepID=A0A1S3ZV24_TOBAC|nr:PREDICTED: pathogenesis-related protein 5-like isoform X1 [Nicotiana tabacum]